MNEELIFRLTVELPGREPYYFVQAAYSDMGTPLPAEWLLQKPLWDDFTSRALREIRKHILETQAPI